MAKKAPRPWRTVTIAGGAAAFLLLLGLSLPHLINLRPIKERIVAELSQRIGAPIRVRQINLALLPTPRVRLEQVSVSLGETAAGTVDSISAYPELFPLLTGAVNIRSLRIVRPKFQLKPVTAPSFDAEVRTAQGPEESTGDSIVRKLQAIRLRSPARSIQVEDGQVEYLGGPAGTYRLEQINGRFDVSPGQLQLEADCRSNLWRHVALMLNMDDRAKMEGAVRLDGFQPQPLYDHLFPAANLKLSEAQMDLAAKFKSDAFTNFELDLQGSNAKLGLTKLGETIPISGRNFSIFAQSNRQKTVIQLQELVLDAPQLSLSGAFTKQSSPAPFELALDGRNVDVDAVRHAALALLGEYADTRKIFEILVGGTVPAISFSTHGNQLHELGKAENIVITGSMTRGKLFIPKARLDLTEVYGDVVITKGILEGKDLRAELGNSKGSEGNLRVGLVGKNAPFHLDIKIMADLVQLPPILLRIVKNKTFIAELEKIKSFEGSARGRMVLGDSLDSMDAVVDVADIKLTSVYERLPYPLAISGGNFFYNETKKIVALKDIKGSLAGSNFSAFSGELTWSKEMQLKIAARKSSLLVREIYPWIVSHPKLEQKLKEFKFDGGAIGVDSLSLKGPLLQPEKWDFDCSGSIQDLAVDWTLFPDTLWIAGGRFKAAPHKLVFTDARTRILDSSLTASATLHQFLEGFNGAELDASGEIGEKTIKWIADLRHIPRELNARPPLTVANGRLVWKRNTETSFSAELLPTGGPRVSIDQTWQQERLIIRKLFIEDDESVASITLDLQPKAFDLGFSGNLTKATADKLLQDNQILTGWVRGDFNARVQLERNIESTATGSLRGEGLRLPVMDGLERVDQFSISAAQNLLNVDSATVYWQNNAFRLNGKVTFSSAGLLLDMNAAVDEILWGKIDELMNAVKKNGGQSKQFKNLQMLGIVRLDAGAFGFGKFTWRPFHADVQFKSSGTEILVTQADLCSLKTPGTIKWAGGKLTLNLKPRAEHQQLNATLACLVDMEGLMEGPYSFHGEIKGDSGQQTFVRSLQGPIAFTAENGRIYRFTLIERLFSVLNFTEIFRGKLPDLRQEGFGYELVEVDGSLEDGRLKIEEAVIEGNSVEMVGRGWVDLKTREVDLTVLVAPLKTLDALLGYVPLISGILGRIASVPVRVTGTLTNPVIIPLSPTAVGAELLETMRKTVQLPLRLIQPLMPSANGKTDNNNNNVDGQEAPPSAANQP